MDHWEISIAILNGWEWGVNVQSKGHYYYSKRQKEEKEWKLGIVKKQNDTNLLELASSHPPPLA